MSEQQKPVKMTPEQVERFKLVMMNVGMILYCSHRLESLGFPVDEIFDIARKSLEFYKRMKSEKFNPA